MQARNVVVVLLAVLCLRFGPGQPEPPFILGDDSGFVFAPYSNGATVGETQSTIVPPGTQQCAEGRLLVTDERNPGVNGSVRWVALNDPTFNTQAATFTPPNQNLYAMYTSDHDLLYLGNGEVWYVTGAFTKRALMTPPGKPTPPWFATAYRNDFGPGARSVAMVWRSTNCGQSFQEVPSLEFDPARIDMECAMPQGRRTFRHRETPNLPLIAPFGDHPGAGDNSWRYCGYCGQLAFKEGVCNLAGKHSLGGEYKALLLSTGAAESIGWQSCKNCGTLFEGDNTACPAQLAHDDAGSAQYQLISSATTDPNLEAGWHRCAKCQTIFRGEDAGTRCPAGGHHEGAGAYQIPLAKFQGTGETGWRVCRVCRGLIRPTAQGGTGVCPFGGAHVPVLFRDYKMLTAAPPAPHIAEQSWRLCRYCQAGYYSNPNYPSFCPNVRPHEATANVFHRLLIGETDVPRGQAGWRRCAKCGAAYFRDEVSKSCPIGDPGEQPIYDAGGSDGQLAYADPANHRVFLTFQCVGRKPELGTTPFTLTAQPINKTLLAVSSNGSPWKLLGKVDQAVWRMGVTALTAEDVMFGFSDKVLPAKFNGLTMTLGTANQVKPGLGWAGIDTGKPPYDIIHANLWAHTVIARTPGKKPTSVLLASPDRFVDATSKPGVRPRRQFGYRLFFYDRITGDAKEAIDGPVRPESDANGDIAFHLQVLDPGGDAPVLLTWNEYSLKTNTIQVRGRFITGELQMTSDFTLSRANTQARTFDAGDHVWYGDYQTSSGFASPASSTRWDYKPIWVEPGNRLRVGHVSYFKSPSAFVINSRANVIHALPVDLSKLKPQVRVRERDLSIIESSPPRRE